MADESRRLRTQADRATDDHVWRRAAESRPGYATWPDTRAGDPSWWRRGEPIEVTPGQVVTQSAWVVRPQPGPAPVDGETCTKWCGYCHPADERELARVRDAMDRAFAEPLDGPPRREPPPDKSWVEMASPPPRRRWWHRYTRRNP